MAVFDADGGGVPNQDRVWDDARLRERHLPALRPRAPSLRDRAFGGARSGTPTPLSSDTQNPVDMGRFALTGVNLWICVRR